MDTLDTRKAMTMFMNSLKNEGVGRVYCRNGCYTINRTEEVILKDRDYINIHGKVAVAIIVCGEKKSEEADNIFNCKFIPDLIDIKFVTEASINTGHTTLYSKRSIVDISRTAEIRHVEAVMNSAILSIYNLIKKICSIEEVKYEKSELLECIDENCKEFKQTEFIDETFIKEACCSLIGYYNRLITEEKQAMVRVENAVRKADTLNHAIDYDMLVGSLNNICKAKYQFESPIAGHIDVEVSNIIARKPTLTVAKEADSTVMARNFVDGVIGIKMITTMMNNNDIKPLLSVKMNIAGVQIAFYVEYDVEVCDIEFTCRCLTQKIVSCAVNSGTTNIYSGEGCWISDTDYINELDVVMADKIAEIGIKLRG